MLLIAVIVIIIFIIKDYCISTVQVLVLVQVENCCTDEKMFDLGLTPSLGLTDRTSPPDRTIQKAAKSAVPCTSTSTGTAVRVVGAILERNRGIVRYDTVLLRVQDLEEQKRTKYKMIRY